MTVLIQSFSFQRTGYPEDKTGNGGGFVFDCRAIDAFDYSLRDNPAASFPYMHLIGLDSEVSLALDEDLDTQNFFEAVWVMVKLDIEKCIKRGFKVMTVNFGCVAGQHRSVYLAERLYREIRSIFQDVWVKVVHLEKEHWPTK